MADESVFPEQPVTLQLGDEVVRAVALYAAVHTAGQSMQDPDPLHYVGRFERYIRDGLEGDGDDADVSQTA